MFRSFLTSFSICLQGTLFERRPRKSSARDRQETWYYSIEKDDDAPPYLMVAEEFKVKYDLISKMHSRDVHRSESKRGRAKWCPEKHEQIYNCQNEPHVSDPRVEVYYNALGLGHTREATAL